jgi:hypothetical protein
MIHQRECGQSLEAWITLELILLYSWTKEETAITPSILKDKEISGMGESEFWLGLESHFAKDSDSTRTRKFCDVDSTVWLESFIEKPFHIFFLKNHNL